MFKLSSFLFVLSLITVSIVVATPSHDDGLGAIHYGCCILWEPWAWAKAAPEDEGWYSVWAEIGGTRQRYSGSYDGKLDVEAKAQAYTGRYGRQPPNYHASFCN